MNEAHKLGQTGEQLAVEYLTRHGFQILAQRWKSGRYEIDIIAQRGKLILFAEVKTRVANPFGVPDIQCSIGQMNRIARSAMHYLDLVDWDGYWRFDFFAVEWRGSGNYLLRHLIDLDF